MVIKSKIRVIVFAAFLVSAPPMVAQLTSPKSKCKAAEVNLDVMNQKLAVALNVIDVCIEEAKKGAAKLRGKTHFSDWEDINIVSFGTFLCIKAQIQSLAGDFKGADQSISEAEDFSEKFSELYNTDLWDWPGQLNLTKGFRVERAGQTAEAKEWYAKSYRGPIAGGKIQSAKGHAYARVAILALRGGDDQSAHNLAEKALGEEPREATASYVLGRLLEKSNQFGEALLKYQKALKDMIDGTGNAAFPLDVVEANAVKEAIAQIAL